MAKLEPILYGTPDGKVHHIEVEARLGDRICDEHGREYVVVHITVAEPETIDYFEESP